MHKCLTYKPISDNHYSHELSVRSWYQRINAYAYYFFYWQIKKIMFKLFRFWALIFANYSRVRGRVAFSSVWQIQITKKKSSTVLTVFIKHKTRFFKRESSSL